MSAIFKREFKTFFTSPIGYFVLAVLFGFSGFYFFATNMYAGSADLSGVFGGLFTIVLCVIFLKADWFKPMFRYGSDPIYLMTAFFALFIFAGVFNSFNARTPRLNLLAHLRGNPSFIGIMALVTGVQLLLIYYGGSLFRTAGLTLPELRIVAALAFLVVPADLLRKLTLRLVGRKGTI